jgi:GNAT superfamily N-acetyltransferase
VNHQIIPATGADAATLSEVIATAFHDLAPSGWLISDPTTRRQVFPGYFRILVEHALATGAVHTTPGRTAAALWLPVGTTSPAPPVDYPARLAAVTGPFHQRFMAFDAALDRHHPTGTAHHHLAILAVHPHHQNTGMGAALLNSYHRMLDTGRIPAYLEASSPRSLGLYRRHGYTLLPGTPFHLPGHGPPMWPLWRPPRPPAPGHRQG